MVFFRDDDDANLGPEGPEVKTPSSRRVVPLLPLRDIVGTLMCTPAVAYLVHLWLELER